jgi:hypothetical protein
MGFKQDLEIAQKAEQDVKELFESRGHTVTLNGSDTLRELRKYDMIVIIRSDCFILELKLDIMSEKTGNVCVEETALNHTMSDIFAYILGSNLYLYRTDRLKDMVQRESYKRVTYGGDQNHKLYLFDAEYFKRNANQKLELNK